MNASELIARLIADGPVVDADDVFLFLAGHIYDVRLADGERVLDATDFAAFLREIASAIKTGRAIKPLPAPKQLAAARIYDTCPRCGHVHQGEHECGEDMGGGRICRCEMFVPV